MTLAKCTTQKKCKKKEYTLHGGPFDKCVVELVSSGTLPIKIGRRRGYYDANNQWKAL